MKEAEEKQSTEGSSRRHQAELQSPDITAPTVILYREAAEKIKYKTNGRTAEEVRKKTIVTKGNKKNSHSKYQTE